jgi:hypothetical protein
MAELHTLFPDLYGKLADPCGAAITVSIPAAGCTADELRDGRWLDRAELLK